MSDRDDRFLSRWSRLKQRSRSQQQSGGEIAPVEAPPVARDEVALRAPLPPQPSAAPGVPAQAEACRADDPASPAVHAPGSGAAGSTPADLPLRSDPVDAALPPLESLTPDSDFRPFMRAGIDASTRNAALKRLFTDPQFNVMDGLDVYIDDYGKTEPIPPALLRRLVEAQVPKLFGERDANKADAAAVGEPGTTMVAAIDSTQRDATAGVAEASDGDARAAAAGDARAAADTFDESGSAGPEESPK